MMRSRLLLSVAMVLAASLAQAAGASVTTDLGTYTGPNIDFTLIEETTQDPIFGPSDDADAPLFGTASGSGNSLIFTPDSFIASATGAAGAAGDEDHATLNIMMESLNPLVDTIDLINITELGDYTLQTIPPNVATPGTFLTFIYLQMTGNLLITEISDGVTTMDATGLGLSMAIEGFFDIGDNVGGGSTTAYLDTDQGSGTWSGTDSLDVSAYLAGAGYAGYGATKATLALDNKLWAFSESGTVATVQKKIGSDGVIIDVIPEPTTGLLVAAGLIGLGIRSRRTRV